MLPRHVLSDETIPVHAKMVYLALSSHVGESATVWPSHTTLARLASCSPSQVKRMLKLLRERGLIDWKPRRVGEKIQLTNEYWLILGNSPAAQQNQVAPPDLRSDRPQVTQTPGLTEPRGGSGGARERDPLNERTTTAAKPRRARKAAEPKPAPKPRERNVIWDAVVEVCGINPDEITTSQASSLGKIVRELTEVNATAAQIQLRAKRYHERWEGRASLTPTALAKHWSSLGESYRPNAPSTNGRPTPAPVSRQQVAAVRIPTTS